MKCLILFTLCVAMASVVISAPAAKNEAAHARNRRSQYANLLNSILQLSDRQEAEIESEQLVDALAEMEEYGLLDDEQLANLQDYVNQQTLPFGNILGSMLSGGK